MCYMIDAVSGGVPVGVVKLWHLFSNVQIFSSHYAIPLPLPLSQKQCVHP